MTQAVAHGYADLRHLGPRTFDLVESDATTFAHATEYAAGYVEEVLGTIELLEEGSGGTESSKNSGCLPQSSLNP